MPRFSDAHNQTHFIRAAGENKTDDNWNWQEIGKIEWQRLDYNPQKKKKNSYHWNFKAAVEQNWVELLETLEKFQLFLNSSIHPS